jgi:hypothetical protein
MATATEIVKVVGDSGKHVSSVSGTGAGANAGAGAGTGARTTSLPSPVTSVPPLAAPRAVAITSSSHSAKLPASVAVVSSGAAKVSPMPHAALTTVPRVALPHLVSPTSAQTGSSGRPAAPLHSGGSITPAPPMLSPMSSSAHHPAMTPLPPPTYKPMTPALQSPMSSSIHHPIVTTTPPTPMSTTALTPMSGSRTTPLASPSRTSATTTTDVGTTARETSPTLAAWGYLMEPAKHMVLFFDHFSNPYIS